MRKKGLDAFVQKLIKHNELITVNTEVSPELEVTEITDRISKLPNGGKALLFSNNSTKFPILINSLGSDKRLSLAFHQHSPEELSKQIESLAGIIGLGGKGFFQKLSALPKLSAITSWMPKNKLGKGLCQENVMVHPDLNQLPVLKCWPHDGGPFVTLPLVHTIDPQTGIRNVGMYRMQVFDATHTGMHWHIHKTGARHYREYKKLAKLMPVAVVLGGDPVYTYCATAPLPDGIDEYILAGFIRKKKVEMVKCLTQDIWVPEDADIVIEGFVDPSADLVLEGPFGDHTGFYSLEDLYPVFHVTAITYKNGAIYPATIVGIPPQEDAWLAKATEQLFIPPIKMAIIPELKDMHMPEPGVAHNIVLLNIHADYPGHARKVFNTVWGAGQMMFTKLALAVDGEVSLRDYLALGRWVSDRIDPFIHASIGEGPLDILDHASDEFAYGGKLGLDASGPPLGITDPASQDVKELLQELISVNPIVSRVNTRLLDLGISMVILGVRKQAKNDPVYLLNEILGRSVLSQVRFWILVDDVVEIDNFYTIAWIIGSHIDAKRDVFIKKAPHASTGVLLIDATRKTTHIDNFKRDWPNPVLMSNHVIQKVDAMWDNLNVGSFIKSPSLPFRSMEGPGGAISYQ